MASQRLSLTRMGIAMEDACRRWGKESTRNEMERGGGGGRERENEGTAFRVSPNIRYFSVRKKKKQTRQ